MTVDGLLQGAENIWGPNGFWWEFETDPLSLELLMGERDHAGWRRGYPPLPPAPRKEGRPQVLIQKQLLSLPSGNA